MLEEVTFYTVRCDGCGVSADKGTDYAAWSEPDGAWESADQALWSMREDKSKVWCPECAPVCEECGELECKEHGEAAP